MNLQSFFSSLLMVVAEMAPYLLLGFLIAGVLHVYVPQRFYARYLSADNRWSVLWAALLGVPLPLCSCGVIPTAIGLRNEKASKGALPRFSLPRLRRASTPSLPPSRSWDWASPLSVLWLPSSRVCAEAYWLIA